MIWYWGPRMRVVNVRIVISSARLELDGRIKILL